jgi:hypothetical protein
MSASSAIAELRGWEYNETAANAIDDTILTDTWETQARPGNRSLVRQPPPAGGMKPTRTGRKLMSRRRQWCHAQVLHGRHRHRQHVQNRHPRLVTGVRQSAAINGIVEKNGDLRRRRRADADHGLIAQGRPGEQQCQSSTGAKDALFAGDGTRAIEVPEWGESAEKPLVIYFASRVTLEGSAVACTNIAGNKLGANCTG